MNETIVKDQENYQHWKCEFITNIFIVSKFCVIVKIWILIDTKLVVVTINNQQIHMYGSIFAFSQKGLNGFLRSI